MFAHFGLCLLGVTLLLPSTRPALAAEKARSATCPKDVASLLAPFASLQAVRVDFVEEKHIAILLKPLINRGTIAFMAPDQLVRSVQAPEASAVWLRQGQLWVRDASGERKLDVGKWGPANVLVNSFLYVLRGDVENLQRHYNLQLTCQGSTWTLRLVPKDKALLRLIQFLSVVGQGDQPNSLEMLDGSGDRSLTRFINHERNARLSMKQLQELFSNSARK